MSVEKMLDKFQQKVLDEYRAMNHEELARMLFDCKELSLAQIALLADYKNLCIDILVQWAQSTPNFERLWKRLRGLESRQEELG